jgi:hypothetical protein
MFRVGYKLKFKNHNKYVVTWIFKSLNNEQHPFLLLKHNDSTKPNKVKQVSCHGMTSAGGSY